MNYNELLEDSNNLRTKVVELINSSNDGTLSTKLLELKQTDKKNADIYDSLIVLTGIMSTEDKLFKKNLVEIVDKIIHIKSALLVKLEKDSIYENSKNSKKLLSWNPFSIIMVFFVVILSLITMFGLYSIDEDITTKVVDDITNIVKEKK